MNTEQVKCHAQYINVSMRKYFFLPVEPFFKYYMETQTHKADPDGVALGGEVGKVPDLPFKPASLPLRCKRIAIEPSPGFSD